jgi:TrmH family RNA methyltransferase
MQITQRDLTLVRKLQSRKTRREFGKFLVEGVRCVRVLIESNYIVDKILVNESLLTETGRAFLKEHKRLPVSFLEARRFKQVASEKSSQGIIAVANIKRLKNIDPSKISLVLAAQTISDPSNLGSIIRSSFAFGARLMVSSDSADIYSSRVISASSGYIFKAEPEVCKSLIERLSFFKKNSFEIWGADTTGKALGKAARAPRKVALVVGNEAFGLSPEIRAVLDRTIKIPISPEVESLSAPVAAAVMLYALSGKIGL